MKGKLDEKVTVGTPEKVEEPTDRCSNISVIEKVEKVKADGSVKLCLYFDPSQMVNKAIQIQKHTVPTLHAILPRLRTLLDALDELTQETLDEPSN